jgi:hypothetical protein
MVLVVPLFERLERELAAMRHVGNFRQPTADAWVTVFDAFPLQVQAA